MNATGCDIDGWVIAIPTPSLEPMASTPSAQLEQQWVYHHLLNLQHM